jgi:hypothetical protein
MSLRINSDFNGVTDPDAGAYIAAVEAADGQLLEFGVGKAINDFVVGCKADKTWDAIKASCILAGARTRQGALVPLANSSGVAPTFAGTTGGWVYNRKTGLQGNASDNYISSGRNNNADPQDNQHLSVYVSTAATSTAAKYPNYIGAGSSFSGSSQIGRLNNNGSLFVRSRNSGADVPANSTGFIGITRSAANQYLFRGSASSTLFSKTSQAPYSGTIEIGRDPASTGDSIHNGIVAFYSIGESLDLALLDARVTALITAFGVAIP